MQLVLDSKGLTLSVKNRSFLVESANSSRTIGPKKISSIAITATVMISSEAVVLAIKNQIPILFFDKVGKAQARLWSPYFESIATLRCQQVKFAESPLATAWMVDVFGIKTDRQVKNLQYLQNRRPSFSAALADTVSKMRDQEKALDKFKTQVIADCRQPLMAAEAVLARYYWQALASAMPDSCSFGKRSRQPAEDPFNATLNYLYGMLYSTVEAALFAAGLDPHLGILHADEHNKPTLSYDLIEAFRPWVDRLLIEQCLEQHISSDFFNQNQYGYFLNKTGKAYIIPLFNDFLQSERRFQERQSTVRNHIYRLAGQLAQRIRTFDPSVDWNYPQDTDETE